MKKVTKFLLNMMAVALTVIAFHASDLSIGSVKAKGENYLDPVMLSYNVGYQELNGPKDNLYTWYALDIPEDGDLKITLIGDDVHLEKLYPGAETIDSFTWVAAYENAYRNKPVVKHFTTAAGRYYFQIIHRKNDNAKLNVEYTSYGFKDQFDDTYENPKTYVPGTEVTEVVSYLDNVDWYKFEVPENGKYKLNYFANTGCYEIYLYNSDLEQYWYASPVDKNELQTKTLYLLPGTYYFKINGWSSSKYKFSLTKADVNPSVIKKIKSKKKGTAQVTFKCAENVEGYQIRYSTDKRFNSKVKTKTIKVNSYDRSKSLTAILKKLKRHKVYYFQVRSFEETSQHNYFYSDWSKAKKVKIK